MEAYTEWPGGGGVELGAPGILSSVGGEVVGVQVVVARALRQAVVPVQEGLGLVDRLQVVAGGVGLRLEEAAERQTNITCPTVCCTFNKLH